jgi:CysZ protein
MVTQTLVGASYLLRGLRLIHRPGLRPYAYIPLAINTLLFTTFIWLGAARFSTLIDTLLPEWLDWLSWLLWPLFAVTMAIIVFFIFSMIANLIGAPFNGLLAKAVERQLTGQEINDYSTWKELLRETLPAIWMELNKIGYFTLRAVPLLILFLIPGLNVFAPFLWIAFSAWMFTLEYMDYPMGNHGVTFPEQRRRLQRHRLLGLGFGGATMLANSIPLVNFLVMPSAVAGATALWVRHLKSSGQAHQDYAPI